MTTSHFRLQDILSEYCLLLLLLPSFLLADKAIPPKILQKLQGSPEKVNLTQGKRYQLLCTVSEGDLPLTIRWMKNGHSISPSSDVSVRRIDDYASSLVIQAVSEYHTGNYSCVVSNEAGTDSFTVMLQINVEPYWVQQPEDTKVTVGSDAVLYCKAAGNPDPMVAWKRAPGLLSDQLRDVSGNGGGRFRVSSDGSLTISRVEGTDKGFYVCNAGNAVGKELKKAVKLDVLVPPQVVEKYSLVTERTGQWAFLNCSVGGDKPMKITWKKNNQPIDPANENRMTLNEVERESGLESGLRLGALSSTDSGVFVCSAENAHGRTDVRFRLVVVEVPGPPKSVQLVRAWSRNVQIGWEAPYTGNSPITKYSVEYKKDNDEHAKLRRKEFRASDVTAVIKELRPWTRYRFWVAAENVIGYGQLSDSIVVLTKEEEPSSAPSNFRIEMVRATTARLSWQHLRRQDWNGEILGYYIGYKGYDENSPYGLRSIPMNNTSSGQSFILSGLQKISSYKVVVSAFNSVGAGPATDPLTFQTKSGTPPSTPKLNLLSALESLCKIQISPDIHEDEVEEYLLHVKRQKHSWEEVPLSSTGTHLVGGLSGNTEYQMFVTAKNPFGTSEPSQVVTFVTSRQTFMVDDGEPLWAKMSVVLPTAASAFLVLVVCCVTCCMTRRLSRTPKREGVAANDFSYTRPSTSRSESACFYNSSQSGGVLPMHMQHRPPASLPRAVRALQYSEPRPISPFEEPKYECVVEEMKTFIGGVDRRT